MNKTIHTLAYIGAFGVLLIIMGGAALVVSTYL